MEVLRQREESERDLGRRREEADRTERRSEERERELNRRAEQVGQQERSLSGKLETLAQKEGSLKTREAQIEGLVKEHAAGREPDNVTAWLYRVCANLATSRGRRGVVARRFLERRPAEETEVAAEIQILRHETSEALVAALAILPDDARTAVVMAAQGFSGREIAEALGRTETSTRTMMFRARERLRTFLVAEGIAR